jgi:uncharacterized protein
LPNAINAAEKNLVVAHENLGDLYRLGLGVRTDLAEALKWYERAESQGCPDSALKAKQLRERKESLFDWLITIFDRS